LDYIVSSSEEFSLEETLFLDKVVFVTKLQLSQNYSYSTTKSSQTSPWGCCPNIKWQVNQNWWFTEKVSSLIISHTDLWSEMLSYCRGLGFSDCIGPFSAHPE